MNEFDPDAYLAAKRASRSVPAFDPDKYLAEKRSGRTLSDLIRGDGPPMEVPQVGAGETYLTQAARAYPAIKTIANLGATGILQGAKLLGFGESGVKFTPEARAEAEKLGIELPPEDVNVIPGPIESYRDVRDMGDVRAALGTKQNPWAARAGTATGIGLSLLSPLPVAKIGTGISGAVASGALTSLGYGTLGALEHGKADLTKGEVGQALKDIASEAIPSALLGGALSGGVARLTQKASAGVREATADAAQQAYTKAQKAFNSGRSSLGGETSSGSRTLELLERILKDPKATDEQRTMAQQILNSPEGQTLINGVYEETLKRAPNQLGRIADAREALAPLSEALTPQAIDKATEEILANPIKTQFVPRLKTYASRAIPLAVGTAVGGIPGAVAGLATAAALGRPGTAIANAAKHPATRKLFWEAAQGLGSVPADKISRVIPSILQDSSGGPFKAKVNSLKQVISTQPQRFGKYAQQLKRAADKSDDSLAVTNYLLSQQDPEYRQLIKQLENGHEEAP